MLRVYKKREQGHPDNSDRKDPDLEVIVWYLRRQKAQDRSCL